MTSRDFAYWMMGFFEIQNPNSIDEKQTQMIKRHLSLVFKHEIDPSIDGGKTEVAAELQDIHDGINPLYPNLPISIAPSNPSKPWNQIPGNDTTYRC